MLPKLMGSRITIFYTNDIFTGQVRETPRLAFSVTHTPDTETVKATTGGSNQLFFNTDTLYLH